MNTWPLTLALGAEDLQRIEKAAGVLRVDGNVTTESVALIALRQGLEAIENQARLDRSEAFMRHLAGKGER